MVRADIRDIVGGLLVMATGGIFAYAASFFPLGSGRVLGPGYFPIAVGTITAGIGLWIFATAFTRSGMIKKVRLTSLLAVLGAIAAFGLLIQRVGLVPTIIVVVVISALGSPDSRPLPVAALALFMALACWLIFTRGLGLPMPAFRNPL